MPPARGWGLPAAFLALCACAGDPPADAPAAASDRNEGLDAGPAAAPAPLPSPQRPEGDAAPAADPTKGTGPAPSPAGADAPPRAPAASDAQAPAAPAPLPPLPAPGRVDPGSAPAGDYQAEEVPGSPSFEGTGLVWWGDRLIIADRGKKKLFELEPPSTFRELAGLALGDPTGVALDRDGNLLVADCGPCLSDRTRASRIVRVRRSGESDVVLELPQIPTQDLAAHPSGTLYWGGFDHGVVRAAAPGGPIRSLSPSIGHSYGVGLSPGGDALYASSKLPSPRSLYRFPLAPDGAAGRGEVVITFDAATPIGKSVGRLQGLTVDALGHVYVVGSEGQINPAVAVVSPADRKVVAMIYKIPGNRTDVAFGDPDLRTLYITGSGRLHRVRLPVAGTAQ